MLTRIFVAHRKTALALAVLFVLAIPLPHQVVPAWPMRLIDQFGVARPGIETTQTWRHRAYQTDKLSETRRSDEQGRVAFPERMVWGSGLRYLYGVVRNLAEDGTDAGFGPDVWVFARADADNGGRNVYTVGQTPPETMVIHRYGVCVSVRPENPPAVPPADTVQGRSLDKLAP
ncbi:MAG: hypothetical protein WC474_12935 [Hydrogenophilaceae bacterium]